MRPSAADLLAAQLEQAPPKNNARLSPLYASAPPSSTSSFAHSPSSYTSSSKSPLTPATPWTDNNTSTTDLNASSKGESSTGLGLSGMSSPSRTKLAGRGGVSKARVEEEEEELDDELEDELNDFGYGSRTKKKDKKESLLDMLNSEPPGWMTEAEPVPVSLPRKGSLPSKIRKKFSSSAIDDDVQSGFTTLQRGGSKNRKEDTSPLRSSRSASNLLNSFRSRTNNFGFKMSGGGANNSRENLKGSVDLGGSQSSHSKNGSKMLDDEEFERLINVPSSSATTRRLTAKDAISSPPATRDLADFLRSNEPPFGKSTSSVSLATTAASSVVTDSTNARSYGSLEDVRRGGGTGGGGDSPSIVRAAMVKLGSAGRRASLGTSASFQNLVNSRPATSSGIPRLSSPTRTKFSKRPSTGQTVASEESAYDPQNKEAIQVDETLMRGMFGRSEGGKSKDDEEERLRDSQVEVSTPPLDVYGFVAIDERESGGKSPELHRLGSLTKSKSLGNVSAVRRGSGSSPSTSSSPTKLPSPRRKPVPLSNDSSSPPRQIRTSSAARLVALQERDDSTPPTVGESPNKGSLPSSSPVRSISSTLPFSSLVPTSEVKTPTTPYEMYATPPLTPATPATAKSPSTPKHRRRETSANSLKNEATSPPPTAPLPRVPDSRSSSQNSSRKELFRPRSMLLQPSETVSKRLSTLLAPDSDNHLDAPTPATRLPLSTTSIDRPILSALESLQNCMSETANLRLDSTSLDNLVPTLRGLQQSMEHGSKLLGAILARLDDDERTKKEDGVEGKTELEEGKVVDALLGGEEWFATTEDVQVEADKNDRAEEEKSPNLD